jgi:hypothetical protein
VWEGSYTEHLAECLRPGVNETELAALDDAAHVLAATAETPFERIVESARVAGPTEREGT